MDQFTNYFFDNVGNLISSLIFCILGVVLSLIFTPKKKEGSLIQNHTSFQQILIIVQQVFVINENSAQNNNSNQQKNTTISNTNGDNSFIWILAIIGLTLYTRYHSDLINWLILFAIASFLSICTITLKLYRDNQYDKLNQGWTGLIFLLIISDLLTAWLMKSQDLAADNITLLFKVAYYALGLFIMIIPNIFMLLLLIHLFSVNSYISKGGKISAFFIRHTAMFVKAPKSTSAIIVVFCILSIFLSSGVAYDLILHYNEKSLEGFLEKVQ
ncbi:hypothetical protein PAEVO_30870 [Paenibacillus sp. GM2FR]|uniref:hypothetical protein n=1 Tax=Paenibacillus sp. GM2FR TaxID=2059268 RepID=UPI000C27F9CD|nr:hypothetical protein [Paenibacillus sp. GM2FR]PJN56364.1 hypothetical protein PAEVO_30870 [Paenibacillus sp. GM2FR]